MMASFFEFIILCVVILFLAVFIYVLGSVLFFYAEKLVKWLTRN